MEKTFKNTTSFYNILLVFFITFLLITNIITPKYIKIWKFTLTSGILTYPFTFLITDIISELYGKNKAKLTVLLGFFSNILLILIIYVTKQFPTPSGSIIDKQTFNSIFDLTPGIIFSSLIAYLSSQFLDIYLFDKIKTATKGKHLWLRNNLATICSQLFDTFIFTVSLLGIWFFTNREIVDFLFCKTWIAVSSMEFLFKCIFALLDTPMLYLILFLLNKK